MNKSPLIVASLLATVGCVIAASAQPETKTTTAPALAPAQPAVDADSGNLKSTLDLFRSDLNASKIRTLNEVMRMTAEEAAKFWPIYQKYETELTAVSDRKIALIRDFVTLHSTNSLTDAKAGEITERWLTLSQDRLDLWKKYSKEISTAVSPIRGAQFLQVEHQISLLVDINIASEMPLVGQQK
jgi:hypothetical protein